MSVHAAVTVDQEPRAGDLDAVHGWLVRAYWCEGIPRATVERAMRHSLCIFARDDGERLVGFARVISDRATFAYLCDVIVDAPRRGQGIAAAMMRAVIAHPDLQGLRRFALATRDAHSLYHRYGFSALAAPARWMERHDPQVYSRVS